MSGTPSLQTANVSVHDSNIWTLMYASTNSHKKIVELLLAKNADIEATGSSGWTALVRAGGIPYTTDSNGDAAFMAALYTADDLNRYHDLNLSHDYYFEYEDESEPPVVRSEEYRTAMSEAFAEAMADNSESQKCVVCTVKFPSRLYLPCKHLAICDSPECSQVETAGKCPVCRADFTEIIKVFLP